MSSDSSLEGVIDENLEVVVSGTQYGIGKGTDIKVLVSTHGASQSIKCGGSSLGKALVSEFGTERDSTDG